MNHWVLVVTAWIGQLFFLYGRRTGARAATLFGALLDIGAVVRLCLQHQWLIAGLTFVVLPLVTSAVLGFWTGTRKNRSRL
jgi:hypothetical protein